MGESYEYATESYSPFKVGDKIVCIEDFEKDGRYFIVGEEVYVADYKVIEVNLIKYREWQNDFYPP